MPGLPAASKPLRTLCALGLACLSWQARAECTRTIIVPLAPLGISVVVENGKPDGIYPRLLKRISERTGCLFKTSITPQARLESLFAKGTADLLVPATSTSRRDQIGQFVPLMETRAMLLSLDKGLAGVATFKDLMAHPALRVAVVRGNDYGEAYQSALYVLEKQGRLLKETDPEHVARVLGAGMADVAILTPMSMVHAIKEDPRTSALLGRLQMTAMAELPWRHSGVYLSAISLKPSERQFLAAQFKEAFHADEVWDLFQQYYPAEVLNASARRR